VLALTIPFYLIWPSTLTQLDGLLASYSEFDESHVFTDFEGLVSLPLAYNLVRWFANQRCVKSSRFIERVLETEQSVKPTIRADLERLQHLILQSSSDGDNNQSKEKMTLLNEHVNQLERTLDTTGISVVSTRDELDKIAKELMESDQPYTEISPKQLSQIAKAYNMKLPHVYRDVRKALDKNFNRP
jgi:Mor family transcriptional regulator